jgi:hypothetical protein
MLGEGAAKLTPVPLQRTGVTKRKGQCTLAANSFKMSFL